MDIGWCARSLVLLSLLFAPLVFIPRISSGSVTATIKTNAIFSFKAVCPDNPVRNARGWTLDLTCFDTGIKARNEHMLEDLNVKEHPLAWLNEGKLFLNGTSKPVSVNVVDSKQVFSFKLSDFGIPARSHLGLKIQDEVRIEVGP
jgi:hypothetical protein